MAKKRTSDFVQQAEVVCPFYGDHRTTNYSYLTCEGVIGAGRLINRFNKQADMAAYMRAHCCQLAGIEKCAIYKIVVDKYKEDI